jgi:hypothetical protein
VSSVNRRWEISNLPTFLIPAEKPNNKPPLIATKIILLKDGKPPSQWQTIVETEGLLSQTIELLRNWWECRSPKQKNASKRYNEPIHVATISPQNLSSSPCTIEDPNLHDHKLFLSPIC